MENNSGASKMKFKLNFFDAVIILIILAAGAVALWLLYKPGDASSASVSSDGTVTYTVELTNMLPDAAEKIKEGDIVSDNVQKYTMGTVQSVEIQPYTVSVKDYNTGNYVISQVPDRVTAVQIGRAHV